MPVVSCTIGDKILTLEEGKVAKQANGAVSVRLGDTVVLVTVTASKQPLADADFFPLVVEYREKSYAAGKIPGGFFKREGKPREQEITASRLIDRPIRPLFPEGFRNEIQIMGFVLSSDQENDGDILGIIGASSALSVSDIPFNAPIGACRIGRVKEKFIVNPTNSELKESDIDLIIVGNDSEEIIMLEGMANELKEEDILAAIDAAKPAIKAAINLQNELKKICGKSKTDFPLVKLDEKITNEIRNEYSQKLLEANFFADKTVRRVKAEIIKQEALASLTVKYPEKEQDIISVLDKVEAEVVRKRILETDERPDGRLPKEIRAISGEISVLPRTHGSAIFTRGQTQALVVVTLGTKEDSQMIEELKGKSYKKYMLHYNFPPFSTGEVKPVRGPGRREIGHGALAERAILPLIPSDTQFPYTIQIVSDIMESNGSSSMATVCGASLSLMDAGVPIKTNVAGIAMGLIKENTNYKILTDIQGLEDHFGDMDFKIAGTKNGITAIQLDIKLPSVNQQIIKEALFQANEARNFILNEMSKIISAPHDTLSNYAPRIVTISVNPDKIKDIIGPGGKTIKKITEETHVTIDILEDGKLNIASTNPEAASKAISIIKEITQEAELGKIYFGKVKKVADFGAFVEIFPGTDGLIHISQLAYERVKRVEDILREGDEVFVKVIDIENGRIKLSRKEALDTLKNKNSE